VRFPVSELLTLSKPSSVDELLTNERAEQLEKREYQYPVPEGSE
jgi:hypothetical protein